MGATYNKLYWQGYATDENGNIITNATVTVTHQGTGALMSLRANPVGGNISNPFTTGSDGKIAFAVTSSASNGLFGKINVTKGAFSQDFEYVQFGVAGAYDVGVGTNDLMKRADLDARFKKLTFDNLTATTDPTVNDDSDDGYVVGSQWVNTASSPLEAFVCLDATVGAAVWVTTTLTIGELGTAALVTMGTGGAQLRTNAENEAYFNAALTNNVAASADPTVTNDVNEGYSVLSIWINQSASPEEIWQCTDNTAGAAVWSLINATTASFGTIATYDQGTAAGEIRINSENEAQFAPKTSSFEINEQTGTSYTVVAGDIGKVIRFTNGSPITLTINSGFTNGFNFLVEQAGAGAITWAGTATLNSLNSQTKSGGQYAVVSFIATNTDEFTVSGDYA